MFLRVAETQYPTAKAKVNLGSRPVLNRTSIQKLEEILKKRKLDHEDSLAAGVKAFIAKKWVL